MTRYTYLEKGALHILQMSMCAADKDIGLDLITNGIRDRVMLYQAKKEPTSFVRGPTTQSILPFTQRCMYLLGSIISLFLEGDMEVV